MTPTLEFLKDKSELATLLVRKSYLITLGFYSKAYEVSLATLEDSTIRANKTLDSLAENGKQVEDKLRERYGEISESTREVVESRIEDLRKKLNLYKEKDTPNETLEQMS
jgi:hypothetical protein